MNADRKWELSSEVTSIPESLSIKASAVLEFLRERKVSDPKAHVSPELGDRVCVAFGAAEGLRAMDELHDAGLIAGYGFILRNQETRETRAARPRSRLIRFWDLAGLLFSVKF